MRPLTRAPKNYFTATAAWSPGIAFVGSGRVIVTRGKPLPRTYICRNMAWRRGTINPHADFRCGRFPSPGRAREHPACGLCGARSCARRVAGPVERVQPSSPRHAFSPRHVPAAKSACQMIGSNSENPITPTSRRSPGPVYLYERRGVYGA